MKLLAIRISPASHKHGLQQEVANLKEQHAKAQHLHWALGENTALEQQLQQAAAAGAATASAPAGTAAQAQGSGGSQAHADTTSVLGETQMEQVQKLEAQVAALAAHLHDAQVALAGAQQPLAEERAAHQRLRAGVEQRQQDTQHAPDSSAATPADQAGAVVAAIQMMPGGKASLAAQLQQAGIASDGIKAVTPQQQKQDVHSAQIGLPVSSAAVAPAGAPCLVAATLNKSMLERLIEDDSWWPTLHGHGRPCWRPPAAADHDLL